MSNTEKLFWKVAFLIVGIYLLAATYEVAYTDGQRSVECHIPWEVTTFHE
jgi:hypothetical protein